jgi:hypothetical protein
MLRPVVSCFFELHLELDFQVNPRLISTLELFIVLRIPGNPYSPIFFGP